jgi:hypothetical protein
MKATVKRDIDIENREVAEECYGDFTEKIIMSIQDFLIEKYDIDYDSADSIANTLPKEDFIAIMTFYLEKVKDDKFF